MQQFGIRDVEHLLGIKAHTLRIWEQRYNFIAPGRNGGTHRAYSNEDLKLLLQVAFLYHQGWKISHIATLNSNELAEQVIQVPLNGDTYPHFVMRLLAAALAFDEVTFTKMMEEITALIGFERSIEEVAFPFLQRVGRLWMTNHMMPAQEHFSSYLIQNRIIAAIEQFPLPPGPANLILFSPRGEFHELPLLYLHFLLRRAGWSVLFLGKNVHPDVLQQFADDTNITYLLVHQLAVLAHTEPDIYLEALVRMFPQRLIVAAGAGITQVQRNFINVRLLRSDDEIHDFVRNGQSWRPVAVTVPQKPSRKN